MTDDPTDDAPTSLAGILRDSQEIGFVLASEPRTGALLRALAASKPRGCFVELGTGTGVGTAWLLAGMDTESRLETSMPIQMRRQWRAGILEAMRDSRFT